MLQDVPPYVTASGNSAKPYGINSEGLKRRGFAPDTIAGIKRAYKTLYKSALTLDEAKKQLAQQLEQCPEIGLLLDFMRVSNRGIIR